MDEIEPLCDSLNGSRVSDPPEPSATLISPSGSVDLAGIWERLDRILPGIAASAAQRERDRVRPFAEVAAVARTGLLSARIPTQFGGSGATVEQTAALLMALSAADSNVAQAIRTHFAFVEALLLHSEEGTRSTWFARFLDGQLFSATGAELGARHGEISARIVESDGSFRVNGTKFYSTGCLFAHWIASIALNEKGEAVMFAVPRDRPGVQLLDDFDAIGQCLTASGTTLLENVRVETKEILAILPYGNGRSFATTFAQLYLGCIQAGIARNALSDAIWFAREKARPISHSGVTRSIDDPYVRECVGTMSASVYVGEAAILRAARDLDEAWRSPASQRQADEVAIAVAQAQMFAGEAAMRVAQSAFDVGGASAGARQFGLDRHWRNARIVANHNPLRWKAAVIGHYELSQARPPDSDLF